MNLKTWGWVFAVVFLAIGILGFIPGITTADGMLLGLFMVDGVHNVVHLLTGLVALIVVMKSESAMRMFFKVFGIIYAVVVVIGFVQGDTVFGLFGVNLWDNILHLVVAVVALWLGFWNKKAAMSSSVPMGGGM